MDESSELLVDTLLAEGGLEADELEATTPEASPALVPVESNDPAMTDPDWTKFVMTQFEDDEIYDGWPTTDGLRRVAQKLLGPITRSMPRTIQAPNAANGYHAIVEWELEISWERREPQGPERLPHIRVFGEVGDVSMANTDYPFCLHAAPSAATKAEGRALRKALGLKQVYAAEEMKNQTDDKPDGRLINASQFSFIDMKCHDLNINAVALLNSGSTKYAKLQDIPHATAVKIFEWFNKVQIGTVKLPENLKGYQAGWRQQAGV